jgi:hypothetical protein
MTSGSAQCDKLLVGLRPVSIAVAGNQVQPLAPMTALKRRINKAR